VAHHTGELLPQGVALRLPHVVHVYRGGAVGLVLTLLLTPSIQLRLPENLRGGTAPLGDAGRHQ